MSETAQRIAPAPIRRSIRVKASQERAFKVFTEGMGSWWLESHSLLKIPRRDVTIEPRAGGRWYETGEDGSEQMWGKVVAWEPDDRVLLDWQLTADWAYDPDFATSVEVRFIPEGDHTIVEFEHRDLDRYGEKAMEIRGDYESGMDGGWGALLESFSEATAA